MEVVAALIAGVFSLIAIRYQHNLQKTMAGSSSSMLAGPPRQDGKTKKNSTLKKFLIWLGLACFNYLSLMSVDLRDLPGVASFWLFVYFLMIIFKWRNLSRRRLFAFLFLMFFNVLLMLG